jgi:hypothetical protein
MLLKSGNENVTVLGSFGLMVLIIALTVVSTKCYYFKPIVSRNKTLILTKLFFHIVQGLTKMEGGIGVI